MRTALETRDKTLLVSLWSMIFLYREFLLGINDLKKMAYLIEIARYKQFCGNTSKGKEKYFWSNSVDKNVNMNVGSFHLLCYDDNMMFTNRATVWDQGWGDGHDHQHHHHHRHHHLYHHHQSHCVESRGRRWCTWTLGLPTRSTAPWLPQTLLTMSSGISTKRWFKQDFTVIRFKGCFLQLKKSN